MVFRYTSVDELISRCNPDWVMEAKLIFPPEVKENAAIRLEEIRKLVDFLKENPHPLVKLDISKNGLGDEEAKLLAEVIGCNTCLKHLHMFANFVGEEGGRAICDALANNMHLVRLPIGGVISHEVRQSIISQLDRNKEIAALEALEKEESYKSIYSQAAGSEWSGFINGITASVGNRTAQQFPLARLNEDDSITFCIDRENEDKISVFEQKFNETYIIEQLQSHLVGELVKGKTQLIEKGDYNPTTKLIEYWVNVTPEQLDDILKNNSRYQGYRNENGLIKLRKEYTPKPGVIRLFPVLPMDEAGVMMLAMASGCQIYEMPTVQLRYLLPEYDGKERSFHWIPDQVREQLSVEQWTIDALYKSFFEQQGLWQKQEERISLIPQDIVLESKPGAVRIVEMDENSRRFYQLYSNCGDSQLQHCKSVEIDTAAFLGGLKAYLEGCEAVSDQDQEKLRASIGCVKKMIAIEERRGAVINLMSPLTAVVQVDTHISLGKERPKAHE